MNPPKPNSKRACRVLRHALPSVKEPLLSLGEQQQAYCGKKALFQLQNGLLSYKKRRLWLFFDILSSRNHDISWHLPLFYGQRGGLLKHSDRCLPALWPFLPRRRALPGRGFGRSLFPGGGAFAPCRGLGGRSSGLSLPGGHRPDQAFGAGADEILPVGSQ